MYFLDQKLENKINPCKPQFFYIKEGFKRVYISQTCFPDVDSRMARQAGGRY